MMKNRYRRRRYNRTSPIKRRVYRKIRYQRFKQRTLKGRKKNFDNLCKKAFNRKSYDVIPRPFSNKNVRFQWMSGQWIQTYTVASFVKGVFSGDYIMSIFATNPGITQLTSSYLNWRPVSLNFEVRIADFTQLYESKGTPAGVEQFPIDQTGRALDLWYAHCTNQQYQNQIGNINSDNPNFRLAQMENPNFRRLLLKGKPLKYKWHNPISTQGAFQSAFTSTTTASPFDSVGGAFTSSTLPLNSCHGFVINWFNNSTYATDGTITLQWTGAILVQCKDYYATS